MTPLAPVHLWEMVTDPSRSARARREAAHQLAADLIRGAIPPPDYDQAVHEAAMRGAFL